MAAEAPPRPSTPVAPNDGDAVTAQMALRPACGVFNRDFFECMTFDGDVGPAKAATHLAADRHSAPPGEVMPLLGVPESADDLADERAVEGLRRMLRDEMAVLVLRLDMPEFPYLSLQPFEPPPANYAFQVRVPPERSVR